MTVFKWVGGSEGPDQGRYAVASDWRNLTTGTVGAGAPQPGDTAEVVGVVNAGIYKLGALYIFPIGGGYPLILFYAPQSPLTEEDNPNGLVGYTVQNQTLTIDGTLGAVGLWLQNSQLLGETLNVTGTAVLSSYLDNTITGTITVGTALTPGILQVSLIPADTFLVTPSDHHPVTTLNANITVNRGSTFEAETAANIATGLVSDGTITVDAGGTFILDDTDDPQAATDNSSVVFTTHNVLFGNGGAVNILGGVNQTTTAVLLVDTTGPGTITIDGSGAARAATSLTVDGYMSGQAITLKDGTVTVNDTSSAVADGTLAGYDVTGGSFTFGDANGTLVLNQAELTTLQFNADDTGQVETPDGRTPFTTPISGFRAGDLIALPGKNLASFGFSTYVTSYDAVTGVLQVQSPAGVAGSPPEVLASLTFVGQYNPALFQLSGNNKTEELDLTYNGNPTVSHAIADLYGNGTSSLLWQNTAGIVDAWTMNGTSLISGAILGYADNSWSFLGAADLYGNGKSDLLWQNTAGFVDAWTMDGTRIVSGTIFGYADSSWKFLGATDLYGNGKSDLLWQNTAGFVDAWTMDGTSLVSGAVVGYADSSWRFLGATDLNGNGKSDLLWQNTAGFVDAWTMDGTSLVSGALVGYADSSWKFLGAADLYGQGKSDLLWQNTAGAVDAWTMDGTTIVSAAILGDADSSWKYLGTADLYGNGKADLLWQNTAGAVDAWTMNGTSIVSSAILGYANSGWRFLA